MTTAPVEEMAMPVLDAKALDADPEGVASALRAGYWSQTVRGSEQEASEAGEGEGRAHTLDGQTAHTEFTATGSGQLASA